MKKPLNDIFFFLILTVGFLVPAYLYRNGKIFFWKKGETINSEKTYSSEIPFREKTYQIDYQQSLFSGVEVLTGFENQGLGKYSFDEEISIEGNRSVNLISRDANQPEVVFDVSPVGLEKFKVLTLFVYLKTPPDNLEEITLFLRKKGQPVSFQVQKQAFSLGWNLWQITIDELVGQELIGGNQHLEIDQVGLRLVSTPQTISSASFDLLQGLKNLDFQNDWETTTNNLAVITKKDSLVPVLAVGNVHTFLFLRKTTSVKDFIFQTKITPLMPGSFGLIVRANTGSKDGYYLEFGGIDQDSWEIILRQNGEKALKRGTINNFKFDKGKNYWLKVIADGKRISLEISQDGTNFSKVGSIMDDTFASGAIGAIVRGQAAVLLDEVNFSQ